MLTETPMASGYRSSQVHLGGSHSPGYVYKISLRGFCRATNNLSNSRGGYLLHDPHPPKPSSAEQGRYCLPFLSCLEREFFSQQSPVIHKIQLIPGSESLVDRYQERDG